jgi:hypothetical protein
MAECEQSSNDGSNGEGVQPRILNRAERIMSEQPLNPFRKLEFHPLSIRAHAGGVIAFNYENT